MSESRAPDVGAIRLGEVESLYRESGKEIWRAVYLFSRSAEIADDAVAEAFAQLLHGGTRITSMRPWVWTTAFAIARGELQRRATFSGVEPSATRGVEDEVTDIDLLNALFQLSEKQRASLLLHHLAGFPLRDVARMLGSTPSAVGVHLYRARRRMRTLLEVEG